MAVFRTILQRRTAYFQRNKRLQHQIQSLRGRGLTTGIPKQIHNIFTVADDPDAIPSPALLLDYQRIQQNLDRMVAVAGAAGATILRPHVKTHKTKEMVQMQLDRGITKVKCATIAEMEVCASVDGLESILLAYQPVGPTVQRLLRLTQAYINPSFAAVVDSVEAVTAISNTFAAASASLTLWVDIDCGMHRTGVSMKGVSPVVDAIQHLPGVRLGGIHAYDGHLKDASVAARKQGVEESFRSVFELMDELQYKTKDESLTLIASGSPTVAIHCELAREAAFAYEVSPGTTTLWDAGYAALYPELGFVCAAQLLTRVISKPTPRTVCLDLGHKAVAAEKPLQRRVFLPTVPDAKFLQQSEEHLVIETTQNLALGDVVYGIPIHVCPTVSLYDHAYVVDGEVVVDRWSIQGRSRQLQF